VDLLTNSAPFVIAVAAVVSDVRHETYGVENIKVMRAFYAE
jgi:hypothetical protein